MNAPPASQLLVALSVRGQDRPALGQLCTAAHGSEQKAFEGTSLGLKRQWLNHKHHTFRVGGTSTTRTFKNFTLRQKNQTPARHKASCICSILLPFSLLQNS